MEKSADKLDATNGVFSSADMAGRWVVLEERLEDLRADVHPPDSTGGCRTNGGLDHFCPNTPLQIGQGKAMRKHTLKMICLCAAAGVIFLLNRHEVNAPAGTAGA
jgi:hypothetical protein